MSGCFSVTGVVCGIIDVGAVKVSNIGMPKHCMISEGDSLFGCMLLALGSGDTDDVRG